MFALENSRHCQRERCSVRHINMTVLLAFLAPKLVRAAVEGRLPRGINIERLRDAPAEWSQQFEALGLNPQQKRTPKKHRRYQRRRGLVPVRQKPEC
jgi:hypothetical protein